MDANIERLLMTLAPLKSGAKAVMQELAREQGIIDTTVYSGITSNDDPSLVLRLNMPVILTTGMLDAAY